MAELAVNLMYIGPMLACVCQRPLSDGDAAPQKHARWRLKQKYSRKTAVECIQQALNASVMHSIE